MRFEAAASAVVEGRKAEVVRLLAEEPDLVRQRSKRPHRATLLHYVGANGVEAERQKTPRNAVAICKILLDAGADVNAMADMYGGSSTLGLVATSVWPYEAGLQKPLMALLLRRGADIEPKNLAGNQQLLVTACLANGRYDAALYLAGRGAPLDLEAAAGIGRVDLLDDFSATADEMERGFMWACEYGQTDAVLWLIEHGVEPWCVVRGASGLHWAALGGHAGLVRLLLDLGAPADLEDATHHGTPRDWAEHGGHPELFR